MITRLRITNYRGIEALDQELSPEGAIAKGKNGKGKTSVLKAVRAALAAQDIGADAIRNGADKAEILVDLDNLTVRRAITRKGGALTVSHDLGNGVRSNIASPQAYLTNLLGTSPLDPLDLFLAKPKDRRAKILAALPVTVTVEQLRAWVPTLPDDFDCTGHGLEVLERVRSAYYDARTAANAAAKKINGDAERAREEAEKLAAGVPATIMPFEQAVEAQRLAKEELTKLEAREVEAEAAEERTAKSRSRIAELREKAALEIVDMTAPDDAQIGKGEALVEEGRALVSELENDLESARTDLARVELQLSQLKARKAMVAAAHTRWADLLSQANGLEEALAEAVITAPSVGEIAKARATIDSATQQLEAVIKSVKVMAARRVATEAEVEATAAVAHAAALDDIVTALQNEAPTALLKASDGIPGLTLDGDDIYLDGVSIERGACGLEQMKFAVEIARRANAKSKILIVDKLESIDPDMVDEFVRYATADGYQLIASRVDRGEMVLEAIEPAPKRKNGAAHAAHV